MKKLLTALALSLVTLVPAAFAADTPAPAKPVVKIGLSASLTGVNAFLGETARDAMILAKESLPQDTKYQYEFIFEDDGLEAKKAASVANKLISIDKVNALVSLSANIGAVISPISEKNKVIHFCLSSEDTVADGAFNFNHWTAPSEQARVLVNELEKRGIKKIALFTLNHLGAIAIVDSVKEKLKVAGIEVVGDELLNAGEKDFRTAVAKAKSGNPDIYLLIFFSPELEILTKQIREAGITAPLTSIEAFGISVEPQIFEGAWYVDAADASKGFYEKFETRFGKPPQSGAANVYDIVNILVKGFETAAVAPDAVDGIPTQEAVVEVIHKIDMDGMLGRITIDDKGVVFSPASVKIIKDGKPVLLNSAL